MRRFLLALMLVAGCGQDHVVDKPTPVPVPAPVPPGPTPDPGTKPSYQKVAGYLNTYCAQCHASATFMTSEAALRASGVKNQLYSKRMPPANAGKVLPENVRAEVLLFF